MVQRLDTPARHWFIGDGTTRVFQIPTRIIGDEFIRIDINDKYISDRSTWDIINNSVIFTTAPEADATISFQVATSDEAISQLGNETSVGIVAENIGNVNIVGANIENINEVHSALEDITTNATNIADIVTVATDIEYIKTVSTGVEVITENITNINTVANNVDNVNTVANNTPNVNTVATNMESIKDVEASLDNINSVIANLGTITEATNSAVKAKQSEDNALLHSNSAKASSEAAKVSEVNAKASETTVKNLIVTIGNSETNAATSARNAEQSYQNAKLEADRAETAKTNAETAKTNAQASALDARNSAASVTESVATVSKVQEDLVKLATDIDNDAQTIVNSATRAEELLVEANDKLSEGNTLLTEAKASEAITEAERLTAESYATEPEDIPVKIYSVDVNGNIVSTVTNPAEYSALHWSAKAEKNSQGGAELVELQEFVGTEIPLETTATTVVEAINELNGDIEGLATETGMIDQSIIGLQKSIATINSDITTIEGSVTTGLANKIDKTSIEGSLTSTDATKVLAASQGKAIADRVKLVEDLLASDDTTLDTLQEVVDFITTNREELETLSIDNITGLVTALAGKQATLVNNVNFSTIGGNSLLTGSDVPFPPVVQVIDGSNAGSENAVSVSAVFGLINVLSQELQSLVAEKADKDLSNVETISQDFLDQLETAGVGGGDGALTFNYGTPLVFTASTEWTCPKSGVYTILCGGGGAGGGGGGGGASAGIFINYSDSGSIDNITASAGGSGAGGTGGAGGGEALVTMYLKAGEIYSITVGAGGTAGAGGTSGAGGTYQLYGSSKALPNNGGVGGTGGTGGDSIFSFENKVLALGAGGSGASSAGGTTVRNTITTLYAATAGETISRSSIVYNTNIRYSKNTTNSIKGSSGNVSSERVTVLNNSTKTLTLNVGGNGSVGASVEVNEIDDRIYPLVLKAGMDSINGGVSGLVAGAGGTGGTGGNGGTTVSFNYGTVITFSSGTAGTAGTAGGRGSVVILPHIM